MVREELQLYFENYIFINGSGEKTEKHDKAMERCLAANKYFFETKDLTTYKMAEMIIKMQRHMFDILPNSKHANYDTSFSKFNRLLKFCKQIIKDTEDSASGGSTPVQ